MKHAEHDPRRRQLLASARNAGIAGAAAAVLGPAAVAEPLVAPAPARPAPPAKRGYHETEHTRRYYQLARF